MSKPQAKDDAEVLAVDRIIYDVMMVHVRLQDVPSMTGKRYDCSCGMYFPSVFAHVFHVAEEIATRLNNQ